MISTKNARLPRRPSPLSINTMVALLFCVLPVLSWAAAPSITTIADQSIARGGSLSVAPTLQSGSNANVNWSIAYGPDDAQVAQGTGRVTWSPESGMPAESFYIGLRASNQDGEDIQYFIVHVGVPKVVYVGPSHAVKDLRQALTANAAPGNQFRQAGTTFVVENGSYSSDAFMVGLTPNGNLQLPPGGNASAYSTVMAQTPGQVTLSGQASISIKGGNWNSAYMAIKGFYMDKTRLDIVGSPCLLPSPPPNCTQPHHIKIEANGINLGTQSFFGASDSSNLLFENNYVFGGRRVKLLFFRTENVIARRNVARFDWATEPGPQNTFAFYSTVNGYAQNNIAIDSDNQLFWPGAEDAGEFGCPVSQGDSKVAFNRNIQLNSEKAWGNLDSQASGKCVADLSNNLSWDARPRDAGHVIARGAVDIDHMTIGDTDMALSGTEDGGLVFGFPGESRGFRNSLVHNVNAGTLFGYFPSGTTSSILGRSYPQTGLSHVNLSKAPGQITNPFKDADKTLVNLGSFTNQDPIYTNANPNGGLKYILRAEPNSNLSGLASDNLALGAKVMTMHGKNGTFIGQSGYNQDTGRQMWPFPLQEVIQEKMRSMSYTGPTYSSANRGSNRSATGSNGSLSGNRGFARGGQDLTHYIWGYLGNAVPPMNVTAQTDGQNTIIRWDSAPSSYLSSITGFKVYDYNTSTGQISNPRNVGANQSRTTISGSGGRTDYVVTAVHRSTGEGGYSYPANRTRGALQADEPISEALPQPRVEQATIIEAPTLDVPNPATIVAPTLRVIEVTPASQE